MPPWKRDKEINYSMKYRLLSLLFLLVLAACASSAPGSATNETPPPSTGATAQSPAPSETLADPSGLYGRTEDGAFFYGAADAPVTLIDYSDFL